MLPARGEQALAVMRAENDGAFVGVRGGLIWIWKRFGRIEWLVDRQEHDWDVFWIAYRAACSELGKMSYECMFDGVWTGLGTSETDYSVCVVYDTHFAESHVQARPYPRAYFRIEAERHDTGYEEPLWIQRLFACYRVFLLFVSLSDFEIPLWTL